jgi:hypothetical protein
MVLHDHLRRVDYTPAVMVSRIAIRDIAIESLDLSLEYHDNQPRLSVKGEPS